MNADLHGAILAGGHNNHVAWVLGATLHDLQATDADVDALRERVIALGAIVANHGERLQRVEALMLAIWKRTKTEPIIP